MSPHVDGCAELPLLVRAARHDGPGVHDQPSGRLLCRGANPASAEASLQQFEGLTAAPLNDAACIHNSCGTHMQPGKSCPACCWLLITTLGDLSALERMSKFFSPYDIRRCCRRCFRAAPRAPSKRTGAMASPQTPRCSPPVAPAAPSPSSPRCSQSPMCKRRKFSLPRPAQATLVALSGCIHCLLHCTALSHAHVPTRPGLHC